MVTQRVQMKGILSWLIPCTRRAGTRDYYPALATLVSTVQNIFFPSPVHYFTLCDPISQLPGQAVVQGRLSLCASG
jgi:hypothetical protein